MSVVLIPEELSMIVSSNPANGAVNISNNGSQFEIAFNGDGIAIPKEALNVNVVVQESTIWWTTPNIEQNKNNTIYLRGEQSASTISSVNLGFDPNVRYNINNDFLFLSK